METMMEEKMFVSKGELSSNSRWMLTYCLVVIAICLVIVGPAVGMIRRGDDRSIAWLAAWVALTIATVLVGALVLRQGGIKSIREFQEGYLALGWFVGLHPFLFLLIWIPTLISATVVGPWAFRRWPREF
jgi:uncharacterized membrane protein YkvI